MTAVSSNNTVAAAIRPGWSFGGALGGLLLAAATVALIGLGIKGIASFALPAGNENDTAGVVVFASDGDEVTVWMDRQGQKGRALPQAFETSAGPVALRITRRVGTDQYRSDIIHLKLERGCQHLVSVGDEAIAGNANERSTSFEFGSHFMPPGVIGFDQRDGTLRVADGEASTLRPLAPNHPIYFKEADATLNAGEHVLVVANPYPDVVECEVSTDQWSHEISLPGPICHVVPVGEARRVHVVMRLAPRGQTIEDKTIELPEGTAFYTVGGKTAYRWTSADNSPVDHAPPAPSGSVSALPTGVSISLSTHPEEDHWLLAINAGQSGEAHLTVSSSVSLLPPIRQPLGEMTIHPRVSVTEINVPGLSGNKPVTAIATDGKGIIGVIDGMACDLSSGKPLHERGSQDVARLVIGKFGLVLLMSDGTLSAIQDNKLAAGPAVDQPNPTIGMTAATGDEAAVWFFRADKTELVRRKLDSREMQRFNISGAASDPGTTTESGITALATAGDDLLVARGRRIDRAQRDESLGIWQLKPLVILPEASDEPIIGVADVDGRLIFSTRRTVFTLQGDTVLPLVDGVGGSLYGWGDGVLVHDVRTRRLFHLGGAAFGQSAAEAGQ